MLERARGEGEKGRGREGEGERERERGGGGGKGRGEGELMHVHVHVYIIELNQASHDRIVSTWNVLSLKTFTFRPLLLVITEANHKHIFPPPISLICIHAYTCMYMIIYLNFWFGFICVILVC